MKEFHAYLGSVICVELKGNFPHISFKNDLRHGCVEVSEVDTKPWQTDHVK